MSEQPPILEGTPLSDAEERELQRLVRLFEALEAKQVDSLDQAGKRIIELTTAMLGIFFAVAALGDKFPPAYLVGNTTAQTLAAAALILYFLAMAAGIVTLQPRKYKRYEYNVTGMKDELQRLTEHKARWFRLATALFLLASLALVALVLSLIAGVS